MASWNFSYLRERERAKREEERGGESGELVSW